MSRNRLVKLRKNALATAISFPLICQGAAFTSLAFAPAVLAQSQSSTVNFNISPGSLANALNQLARQSGVLISASAKLTEGKQSTGLKGKLSVPEALLKLLTNSGLKYQINKDDTISLSLDPQSAGSSQQTDNLDTLVVIGTEPSRYEFDKAESATGFKTDIDELPRTVQVLPEQLLIDQNADDLTDLLTNSAAVTRAHGFGGTETQVNIRGFTNNHLFVDGNPVSIRHNIDVANIERAEVILGPASVLHGQVSPGGLVNIITKKPQEESAHSIQAEVDEHGKRKLTVDSTGALTNKLLYRVIISGEDSETFREVSTSNGTFPSERQSLMIAPSLTYAPDEKNIFTLRLNHTEQELPIDRGTVAVDDGSGSLSIADIPRERRLGSEHDIRDSEENMIQLDWDHEFESGWTNRFKMGYYEKQFDDYQTRPVLGLNSTPTDFDDELAILSVGTASSSVQSNGLLARRADSNSAEESDLFLSNSLSGDYEIADIDNTLYIGGNYYRRKTNHTDGVGLIDTPAALQIGFGFSEYMPDIDVINIYDSSQASSRYINQSDISNSDETADEIGLSIQNLAYLTDRLNLLLGLRYDRYELDQTYTKYYETGTSGSFSKLTTPEKIQIDSSNDNISGQAGVHFDMNEDLSVYASYAESFTPNYPDVTEGVTSFTGDFAPEEAKQYEVGLKSSFLDDKLRVSAAVYKLERKNVMTFDTSTLTARLNGKEETKGIDLSTTMQFMEGLNVLASYSYMDAEIVNDNDDSKSLEGNTPYGIPESKARIWGSYEFLQGDWVGLGFGLGAENVDSRFGNDTNTFELPGYTVFDTAAWYYIPLDSQRMLRLQAGIKNLTNKTYYTANGSGNAYRINVGDPRTVYLTAKLAF